MDNEEVLLPYEPKASFRVLENAVQETRNSGDVEIVVYITIFRDSNTQRSCDI